jgi:hypothetical protein
MASLRTIPVPVHIGTVPDEPDAKNTMQGWHGVAYQALAPLVHDHRELVHDESERPQLASSSRLLPKQATLSFVYKELHDSVHLVIELLLLR